MPVDICPVENTKLETMISHFPVFDDKNNRRGDFIDEIFTLILVCRTRLYI